MAFVQMVNAWFDVQFSKKTNTADAQYLFLNDPCFGVAAVKMSRDQPVDLGVSFDICIKQIKRNTANVRTPSLCENFAAAYVNADHHPLAGPLS